MGETGMTQALYRKWRPQTFDDVVGQEHIVRTLRNALHTGHLHHAYLLAGPRGTGKTTTARLIAKAVNCLSPLDERPCDHCEICQAITAGRLMDLVEIDAASNTGVDNIRDLLEKVGFRPAQARYKVYVVDEVHMLSTAAFNALLKTLEEPPEHVIFVLATTEIHKIPETILSRCQRFEFRRIPLTQLVGRLQAIAEAESIQVEQEALDLIARAATGSMRDAISLFDQMAAGGDVTADYVRLMLGAERREVVQSLLQAWLAGDLGAGVEVINRAVDGGADPRQLARQTADFLRGLLLMRLGAGEMWTDPTTEERPRFQEMSRAAKPERLVEAIRLFSQVAAISRTGWQPQLPLELAFVEATLTPEPAPALVTPQPTSAPSPAAAASPTPTTPTRRVRSIQPGTRAHAPQVAERAGEVPPPQTPDTSTSGGPSPELLNTIRERWRQVVGHVQSVKLAALLRDAKIAGVDSTGKLVLLFQHSFHRDNVNQDDNRRLVETMLSESFKQPIYVRCMLEKDWETQAKPAAPPASAPAAKRPAAAPRITAPPEPPEPPEDELIRRAQEELGAVPRFSE
jgi:DNA polymerase-3 subunit gamma/tau